MWPKIETSGPNGITANARNAGVAETIGARTKTALVGRLGDDVFLERQLDAVGEALQQAPRADPVGADALLHPGDDAALGTDREQRHHDEEDEDEDGLDEDEPPRVDRRSP